MRIIFWAPPRLRTKDEGHNISTELVLDLVTAQAVRSVRYFAIHETPNLSMLIDLALLFFPFWWLAYVTMQYENRFYAKDCIVYKLYLLIQMILTVVMMVNLSNCTSSSESQLSNETFVAIDGLVCTSVLQEPTDSQQYKTFAVATAINLSVDAGTRLCG